ncbi:MAG: alpha/beta hydrolase [Alphaproteobacteria bacterium]
MSVTAAQTSNPYGEPTAHLFDAGAGPNIAWYEWGNPDGPVLFLCHATGFHAQVWRQTIANLPEGYRIIAVDMCGHGHSDADGFMTNWRDPVDDIIALIEALDLHDIIGVGHSFGGMVTATAATLIPERFARLVLIDPVILPPEAYANDAMTDFPHPSKHPMAKRRYEWHSVAEMVDRFAHRHPYDKWVPEALADYCQYGLVPNPAGEGVVLACHPHFEASIYMTSNSFRVHDDLHKINCPVKVLRAKQRTELDPARIDFSLSPTWPVLADKISQGVDIYLPQLTHFMPMQDPQLVARLIADPDYLAEDITKHENVE